MAGLRVFFVTVTLTGMTMVLAPLQLLAMRFGWPVARYLPWLWHRVAARVSGIRVSVSGTPFSSKSLLIAANHQSWADIVALGSVLPLSFIAKSEVGSWPVFSTLAKLQRTVFVSRQERRKVGQQADTIAERLNAGDVMVLFAEGTTSDGNRVLPFKTALFGAAQASLRKSDQSRLIVQPVAIAYTHGHGIPLGFHGRPLAAWPGDVELMPHLLAFLRCGAVDVRISFGEPVEFDLDSDRKAVARICEARVAAMLEHSLYRESISR
ncbi:1-acyl-sn-glycerol-3-phosphate acyltransferase [Aureimonas fodinaquatilis]|uniref:1-acyl-sn-glycerol-3-phosphate acyltransferase n=1 Tax=Aureimonas fodinaquatilis TaxID=2565783 RepID=A0A5B0DQ39_9HYPH|nr:1-acyl-sn-glycerol-3-phosphate acyltransferase [Aureimonas fodinaquatilis]KAA0968568.1 1-acyl-sn-glycerol-3-phosphate acyltransferase [Aureimonas fodinaquatilis]